MNLRKPSGRHAKLAAPKWIKIQREFNLHPLTNVHTMSSKVTFSTDYSSKIKVQRLGIKARIKRTTRKYSDGHKALATSGHKKFRSKMRRTVIVIDNEAYGFIDANDVPYWQYF